MSAKPQGSPPINYGLCEKCRKSVPLSHVIENGKVYVSKDCPTCGTTRALVSTDAATWQRKREVCRFDPTLDPTCDLNCTTCARQGEHHPRMTFVDVTNRCNMNCPICIANIPKMGFTFNPPMSYFEKVFDGLSKAKVVPEVLLFGGEPTVRQDVFEIITLGQSKGLSIGIVTNGLKLADEEFCRRLCESGARLLMAFDGRSPDIYTRLRKDPTAYEKKLKALANLKKHTKPTRRHTIMCCVGRKINDKYMRDLIDYCHENRDFIAKMHLIPLTETWEEGEFETGIATTIEDVEKIIGEAFPDEPVEFIPLGLGRELADVSRFFGRPDSTFSGVHPNCESITFLLSDGTRYRPLSHYLKRPLMDAADEFVGRARAISGKLAKLDPSKPMQRLRGRLLLLRTFSGPAMRSLNLKTAMRGSRLLGALGIVGGLLTGKSLKQQFRKYTHYGEAMEMMILPFEEYHSLEGARLCRCKAAFAYEDPDDGGIKTVPVCTWTLIQKDLERRIARKYEPAGAEPAPAK